MKTLKQHLAKNERYTGKDKIWIYWNEHDIIQAVKEWLQEHQQTKENHTHKLFGARNDFINELIEELEQ